MPISLRDVLERLQGCAAGDLQVAREGHGVILFRVNSDGG